MHAWGSETHISWLQLERWALGELPPAEAKAVEQHVRECEVCGARWETVRGPAATRQATPEALRPSGTVPRALGPGWLRRAVRWGAASAAAAAAVLLMVPSPTLRTKGGAATWTLVRQRRAQVISAPLDYAPGDRFKAQVTCAAAGPLLWQVEVQQDGSIDRPLGGGSVRCGNEVALPGAFEITGRTPVQVCLILQHSGWLRSRWNVDATPTCVVLQPSDS